MIRLFGKAKQSWAVGLCAMALLGGVDAAWGQCDFYTVASSPATYIACTARQSVGDTDGGTTDVSLPFSVSIYGNTYSTVSVGSDGFLEFGGTYAGWYRTSLPAPQFDAPTIFAHWDNLDVGFYPSDGVFTATSGSSGSRVFVVEWRGYSYASDTSGLDFEVIFYEGQSYFDVIQNVTDAGDTATVGIQGSSVGPITQYSSNEAVLSNGLSLRFTCGAFVNPGACCDPVGKTCTIGSQASCSAPYFVLGGTCAATPCAPPSNDACSGATVVTGPSTNNLISDGTWATADAIDSQYGPYNNVASGVWFSYTAEQPGYLSITESSSNPLVIAFVAPDCDLPATNGYDNQVLTAGADRFEIKYGFPSIGDTAKILVSTNAYGSNPPAAPYDLNFNFTPYTIPSNDTCSTAFHLNSVTFPYSTSIDNYLATTDTTNCPSMYNGVWFDYTPTWTGYLGCSEGGPQIAAWASSTGACSSMTLTCLNGETNLVPIVAGQTTHLLVGSSVPFPTPPVPLELTFDLVPDDCAHALPVTVPGSVEGNLGFASGTPGGVAGACAYAGADSVDLWYSITVPSSGQYAIRAFMLPLTNYKYDDGFNYNVGDTGLGVSVFSGCGGTQIACGSGTYAGTFASPLVTLQPTLNPGTYLIRVAGTYVKSTMLSSGAPSFRLEVSGPACQADFDGNSVVNVSDIFAFLRAWFAHSTTADIDGNSVVNVSDIFAFLRHWFAHC